MAHFCKCKEREKSQGKDGLSVSRNSTVNVLSTTWRFKRIYQTALQSYHHSHYQNLKKSPILLKVCIITILLSLLVSPHIHVCGLACSLHVISHLLTNLHCTSTDVQVDSEMLCHYHIYHCILLVHYGHSTLLYRTKSTCCMHVEKMTNTIFTGCIHHRNYSYKTHAAGVVSFSNHRFYIRQITILCKHRFLPSSNVYQLRISETVKHDCN